MPFVEMSQGVDGLSALKVANSYGLPKILPIGIGGLGCGGNCNCACNKGVNGFGDWVPTEAELKSGTSTSDEGKKYFAAQAAKAPSASGTATAVSSFLSPLVDAFSAIHDKITAGKANRPPRAHITKVTEQIPDYTTLYVIAGGVVVASALAIALAKGRK